MKLSRIIGVFLAALILFSVCACSSSPVLPEQKESEEPTKPEQPEKKQKPDEPEIHEDTVISFIACGDNIVHTPIYNQAKKAGTDGKLDFSGIYSDIVDIVAEKDLAYINVETLIGGDEYGFSSYPNFNSPEDLGTFLVDSGFDVMNLAHNHMLDAPGKDNALYLRNCAKFFEDKGVLPIGYYSSEADTENIRIIEIKGVKIAWLAFTYDDNSVTDPNGDGSYETTADCEYADEKLKYKDYSLNGHKPGTSPDVYIPFMKKALIEKQVGLAKEKADLVFVSAHWGVEDSYTAPNGDFPARNMQKYYAEFFADLGVDAIIGMHPHVVQPVEWIEGKNGNKCLCIYSLGNLISGMLWGRNMLGAMAEFDIVKSGLTGKFSIENVCIVPTVCHYENGTKNFHIYLFSDYTDELAKKHGCHAKDSTDAKRGKKFSVAALEERIQKTFAPEFLKEGYAY